MKEKIKIITWNVNSVRKRESLIKQMIKDRDPDFIFLQETKSTEEQFPKFDNYVLFHKSEKGKNGVAILTKHKNCEYYNEFSYVGRLVSIKFGSLILSSLYMYNGFSLVSPKEKKMEMFKWMSDKVAELKISSIIGGDFNVVYKPQEISKITPNPYEADEIYEFQKWEKNFVDTSLKEGAITWWDYRQSAFYKNIGFGLDKFYLNTGHTFSKPIVLIDYRKQKPTSDHAPVEIVFFP